MRSRLGTFLAIVIAMATAAPAAYATFPGRNGLVAAWWQHAGKYGDPGTGVSLISRTSGQRAFGFCLSRPFHPVGPDGLCRHPDGVAFSADGRLFATQTRNLVWHGDGTPPGDGDRNTLDIWRVGETEPMRHPVAPFDGAPAWSPDGSLMLVTREGALHLIRRDGTELGALGPGTDPDWSVRGDIAFTRAGNVHVMTIGSHPRRVTFRGGHSPTWAPDGKRLAFVRDTELWTLNLRRGRARRLTSGGYVENPAWSPDGRRIAFVHKSLRLRWERADGRGRSRRLWQGYVQFIGEYGYVGSLSWQARPPRR